MNTKITLADNRISALTALVLFVIITVSLPLFSGLPYDMLCWSDWSTYIAKKGVGNAYGSGSNYMPLYHYFLWIYGKIAGSPMSIKAHIPYLRTATILFDFWGLWMVYKWGKLKLSYTALMLISVVNVAYYYNSVIWGQVDGIVGTLVFAMLYWGWKRDLLLSGIACVLAVNMKLQAIVFVPLWGILMLDTINIPAAPKRLGKMLGGMVLAQVVILLPYMMVKGGLSFVWATVTNATETYPVVSKNAANFWCWIVEFPDMVRDTELATKSMNYRNAGLMLFFVSSFFILLPLLRLVFRRLTNKVEAAAPLPKEQIWLTAALIGLVFFFFNTQMHERYAHPAFIFITVYAFTKRRFLPYILFSVGYFMNLETVFHWFLVDNSRQFFTREGDTIVNLGDPLPFYFSGALIAMFFAATIVYLYVMLIRKEKIAPPVISPPVVVPAVPVPKSKSKKQGR